MFAPLIEHPIAFPIIFVIVLALVCGWRVARSTKLVGRLWLAVSTLWVAFCVVVACHTSEDWSDASTWGTFLFACAWVPFLLLMLLRYIRLGKRGSGLYRGPPSDRRVEVIPPQRAETDASPHKRGRAEI
jgi:hypothetical protein